MSSIIVPMPLGGIFDRIIKLIGKTIGRTSIMTVIVLLPTSILFAFALDVFFSSVADLISEAGQTSIEELDIFGSLIGPGIFFTIALIVQLLGILILTLAATIIGVREMTGERVSWQEALRTAWTERFLPALGQTVIQFLAIMGLFLVPFFLIMMGPFSIVFLLLGVLAILVAVPFGIKLVVGWYFATTVIAVEDCGVFDSLKRSSYLVSGQWWRIFGIVVLFGLIVQFAISLILTPVHFIALYGVISKYIEMMGAMKPGVPDQAVAADMLQSMGFGIGIAGALSQFLSVLISPLLGAVLYLDLRARKGEFQQEQPPITEPLPQDGLVEPGLEQPRSDA